MKKETFTDTLIFFIADVFDENNLLFSVRNCQLALSGDESFRKNRQWIENILNSRKKRKRFYGTIYRLKKYGFLKKVKKQKLIGYVLTEKGKEKALNIRAQSLKKKRMPNGQRVVVFYDIPETMRFERAALRSFIKILGFILIQKSIWSSPYDVLRELEEYIRVHKLKKHVYILKVQNLKSIKLA